MGIRNNLAKGKQELYDEKSVSPQSYLVFVSRSTPCLARSGSVSPKFSHNFHHRVRLQSPDNSLAFPAALAPRLINSEDQCTMAKVHVNVARHQVVLKWFPVNVKGQLS